MRFLLLISFYPLRWIYRGLLFLDRIRKRTKQLPGITISVGNLSAGGTGKTPTIDYLSRGLKQKSQTPVAILMRGYKSTKEKHGHILATQEIRNGQTPWQPTTSQGANSLTMLGDEALIYATRRSVDFLGVGRDRFRNGQKIAELGCRIFLLDDGFQHWEIQRNLDIVLLNASNPWEGGLLPLGRLREPPSALARADIILLTRWHQSGEAGKKIKNYLHNRWPDKPILRADHIMGRPLRLNDGAELSPLPAQADAACAIGQPDSFFTGIESELGITLAQRHSFADHHFFKSHEITRILQEGSPTLLITEKDAVKISQLKLSTNELCHIFVIPLQLFIPAEDEKILQSYLEQTLQKLL